METQYQPHSGKRCATRSDTSKETLAGALLVAAGDDHAGLVLHALDLGFALGVGQGAYAADFLRGLRSYGIVLLCPLMLGCGTCRQQYEGRAEGRGEFF